MAALRDDRSRMSNGRFARVSVDGQGEQQDLEGNENGICEGEEYYEDSNDGDIMSAVSAATPVPAELGVVGNAAATQSHLQPRRRSSSGGRENELSTSLSAMDESMNFIVGELMKMVKRHSKHACPKRISSDAEGNADANDTATALAAGRGIADAFGGGGGAQDQAKGGRIAGNNMRCSLTIEDLALPLKGNSEPPSGTAYDADNNYKATNGSGDYRECDSMDESMNIIMAELEWMARRHSRHCCPRRSPGGDCAPSSSVLIPAVGTSPTNNGGCDGGDDSRRISLTIADLDLTRREATVPAASSPLQRQHQHHQNYHVSEDSYMTVATEVLAEVVRQLDLDLDDHGHTNRCVAGAPTREGRHTAAENNNNSFGSSMDYVLQEMRHNAQRHSKHRCPKIADRWHQHQHRHRPTSVAAEAQQDGRDHRLGHRQHDPSNGNNGSSSGSSMDFILHELRSMAQRHSRHRCPRRATAPDSGDGAGASSAAATEEPRMLCPGDEACEPRRKQQQCGSAEPNEPPTPLVISSSSSSSSAEGGGPAAAGPVLRFRGNSSSGERTAALHFDHEQAQQRRQQQWQRQQQQQQAPPPPEFDASFASSLSSVSIASSVGGESHGTTGNGGANSNKRYSTSGASNFERIAEVCCEDDRCEQAATGDETKSCCCCEPGNGHRGHGHGRGQSQRREEEAVAEAEAINEARCESSHSRSCECVCHDNDDGDDESRCGIREDGEKEDAQTTPSAAPETCGGGCRTTEQASSRERRTKSEAAPEAPELAEAAAPGPARAKQAKGGAAAVVVHHAANGERLAPRKIVCFSSVEIRQYDRVLGDHPSCSDGPPLSIGWTYDKSATRFLSVRDHNSIQARRLRLRDDFVQLSDLIVPRSSREDMLIDMGYSRKEIAAATRMNMKIKSQRRQTVCNLGTISKMEEVAESAGRKVRRVLNISRSRRKKNVIINPYEQQRKQKW